ncbi:MAG: hypothetical protein ACR65O_04505 [Methylomicrobium sp.]
MVDAPQPISLAGALSDGPIRNGLTAHEERDADDTFVADHGDFGRRHFL